jgi:site-specific recombinase XerC
MTTEAPKCNTMDKSQIGPERLVDEYLLVCRTEGKTPKTLRGYRQRLERFCRWLDGDLCDFTVQSARAYVGELQTVRKYEGHPFHLAQDEGLSGQTIKGHVVVLKGFATWLWEEEYTEENVLRRLKTPKAAKKVMTTKVRARSDANHSLVRYCAIHDPAHVSHRLRIRLRGFVSSDPRNRRQSTVHFSCIPSELCCYSSQVAPNSFELAL